MKRSWLLLIILATLAAGCVPVQQPVRPAPGPAPLLATPAPSAEEPTAAPVASPTSVAAAGTEPAATPSASPAPVEPSGGSSGLPAATSDPQSVAPRWQASDVLTVDPSVREGKLRNGLTYLIRKNSEPKNRAELRLVVNAGSTLEDPDQLGLAHFLEHMLFKGTRRFPRQDLINFLESIGMRFGPDINAYTTFDETVYELKIPLDDPQVVSRALDVLVDWASAATIDPAEVESERGVIVEEHRLRQLNASGRLMDKVIPALLAGSRYAERLPIGDMGIVRTASAATLRRFYETWYRPDLMAVVAVGDFDAGQIEAMVRERFSGLQAPQDAPARPSFNVPDFKGTRYVIATDPENPQTGLEVYFKQPAHESRTAGEYRADLVRSLFYRMLNDRYLQISRRGDSPFVGAMAGSDKLVRTAEANIVAAQVEEKNLLPGLDRLLLEVERARRYGFTQPELDRAKADVLETYRRAAAQRESTDSVRLAEEYIRHFLAGESIPGILAESELVQQWLPTISLDEVNRQVDGLIGQDNRMLVVTAPAKQGVTPPSEADLARVVADVATADIQPYTESATGGQLMSSIPQPARIISETVDSTTGVTDLRLANGVRVLLKPTDFAKEEILFDSVAPGGHSLAEDKDYAGARLISGLVSESGVGDLNQSDLERVLAGKSVRVSPHIEELSQGIGGSAAPNDLETAFQLIYLYATQPRMDPDTFAALKSAARAMLANRELTPESALADALAQLSHGDTIRGKAVLPLDEIERADPQRALDFYRQRFANMGQFTFVFVGNFDPARIKELAQRYLGNLPANGRSDKWVDRLPVPVDGVQEQNVYKGQDPRAVAQIVFHGPVQVTPENETRLGLLRRILNIVLREELRQNLSGTYSPSASEHVTRIPQPQYTVSINFTADPARIAELVDAAFAQVDTLRRQGPTADDLVKAKEQEKRVYEESLRQNQYWLGVLTSYALDPAHEDPAAGLKADRIIDAMTMDDIRAAAQEYLRSDRYIKVVLYPASAKPRLEALAPVGSDEKLKN